MRITRRTALTAAAAAPLAAAAARTAFAHGPEAPASAPAIPPYRRVTLGEKEVTTLLSGSRVSTDDPQGTFGMNVDAETFAEASREAYIPSDSSVFFFTPTLVREGENTILFDTGLSAEAIVGSLTASGVAPEDVTHVVLTHMHPDHIGGLMGENGPTFANAEYIAPEVEAQYWAENPYPPYEENVAPLADRLTLIGDGAEIAPGITAVAMYGHTPGHTGFRLDSGDRSLLLVADMTNHYVWSLAHPDWEVRFDADKAAAAETRRRVLGMLAAERMPFVGYHMPFPSIGFVEERGDGFQYIPHSYQLML
jgi:glyoxylase-like metal-dependent hydrolase (beta-lactamase superfamily II)